ncbi:hypothetical protein M885DRAFT_518646 [Pelagophyceae sp. CCMP2097]|nr:hypothetical protein M885DRAFT_518646 [Pelagophyceae sp. CCMP2097]
MRARALLVLCVWRGAGVNLKNGGWVRIEPRSQYDWRCWLLKARYNCKGDVRMPPANAWAHVSDRRTNATWAETFAHDHLGVANRANRRRRCPAAPEAAGTPAAGTPTAAAGVTPAVAGTTGAAAGALAAAAGTGPAADVTNILIMGNSFLRQTFEAMACRWAANVTGGTLATMTPPMNVGGLKVTERYDVYSALGLRRLPFGDDMTPDCHGGSADKFYANFSMGESGCRDDISFVEFFGGLRVFYLFRPWAYQGGALALLKRLDLKPEQVDVLVCNDHCGLTAPGSGGRRVMKAAVRQFRNLLQTKPGEAKCLQADAAFVDFGDVRAALQRQLRFASPHGAYGATNARLTDDGHPCLPGLPDDEVDILFSALADGSNRVEARNVARERDAEFWKSPP